MGLFELFQCGLCVLLAPDDGDDAVGPVGPDVVANDGVGSAKLVACQRESICTAEVCCVVFASMVEVPKAEKAISEEIAFCKIALA